MKGHGEGSRRAWEAFLNRGENTSVPTETQDKSQGQETESRNFLIPTVGGESIQPLNPKSEAVSRGIEGKKRSARKGPKKDTTSQREGQRAVNDEKLLKDVVALREMGGVGDSVISKKQRRNVSGGKSRNRPEDNDNGGGEGVRPRFRRGRNDESSQKRKGEEKKWEEDERITTNLRSLSKETISEIQKLLQHPRDWRNIPAPLKKALREAGFNVRVSTVGTAETPGDILMLSGVDDKGNEVIIPGMDRDDVVALLREVVEKSTQEVILGSGDSHVKEEEVPVVNDELTDVDESGAINSYFVNKDLEKIDQGAGADRLDISEYRKNEDELKRRQKAIADLFAQKSDLVQQEKGVLNEPALASERSESFDEKIVLPKDQERVRILKEKLSEYQARYETYSKSAQDYAEGDPGFDKSQQRILDTLCKMIILKELIYGGEISRKEALEDLEDRYGLDNRLVYEDAYGVIEDYVLNGGLNVSGGTGLETELDRKEPGSETQDAEDVTDEITFKFKKPPLDISDAEIISERKRGKEKSFDTRFETEFGITEEQISQIEGYERLSEGQQKLVLENLREYARDTRGGYLSRAWEGVLKAAGRVMEDKNYVEAVTVLIRNTAQFGPKVHEENGELLTDFIGIETPRQFRKEHKPVFDRFNAFAHQYAKTKVEDLEDGIGTHSKDESKFVSFLKNTFLESRRKHDAYESIQESYENAKRELAQSLAEMGKSESEIAEKLIEIDSKVHSLRLLQTEPEAVDVLKQNPDKGFWQKVGEKVFSKENMTYAGLGFVGRMALTGAMGLYAAPVVASAVGGIRSWNKTSAELREKDRMARTGVRDTSGEALNVVDATRTVEIGGKEMKSGVTQKLQDLIEKYKSFEYKGGKTEERNSVIESMRARVQYIEDKIKLNRINFGSGAERATNMAGLFEALGEARVLLADTEMPKGSALEARLEQYLVKREGLIQTRRRKKQIKTAVWGTLKAGAFALAGRELAEYVKETDFFSKVGRIAGGVTGGVTLTPEGVEASLPKQYGYQAEVRTVDNELIRKAEVPSTKEMKVDAGGVSSESAPKPTSGSALAPSAQVPNSQTAEELQRTSVENGNEGRLYSDGVTTSGADATIKEGSGDDTKLYEEAEPIQNPIHNAKEPELNTGTGSEARTPEANANVSDAGASEAPEAPSAPGDAGVDKETRVGGESPAPAPDQSAGDSIPEPEQPSPEAIEFEDRPVKTTYENEALRTPENSVGVETDATEATPSVYDYENDGGTPLDTESSAPEAKTTPDAVSTQEVFKNANGVEVDPKKEDIYELTGRGGEKVLVSYGGENEAARLNIAQDYVLKNPNATVIFEQDQKYGIFGQKLPPSYIEIKYANGGIAAITDVPNNALYRSDGEGIDPRTFTKKVTK